jgi:YidC/Oxa1 family membrane protein insertase
MSGVFKPLVQLLHWVLVHLHGYGFTWGLSIIALTVIVRLILIPLTFRQFRSAQAMAALQPHLKELQKKHKGDKAKLQQETMRLYQENKVNPFASCLPMILQLPVFFSLYYAVSGRAGYLDKVTTAAIHNASFLWLPHLGERDPYYVLLVIYVISQLVSTELMLTPTTDKQQKMLMRFMPVAFVFILFRFPSGLFLYWITTNLWTIAQQLIIKRTMPAPEVIMPTGKAPAKSAAASSGKKRGRFMESILAAQEEREAKLEAARAKGKQGTGGSKTRPAGNRPGTKKTGSKPGGKPSGKPGGQRPKKASGFTDGGPKL